MSMLENVFTEQIKLYNASSETAGLLWKDVCIAYSKSSRHYHNLHHLDNLLEELMPLNQEIDD